MKIKPLGRLEFPWSFLGKREFKVFEDLDGW